MNKTLKIRLEKPILFFPQLAKVLGGNNEAIFWQQFYYWRDKTASEDGFVWKSKEEIEEETNISPKQQDRIRKKLVKLGALEVKKRKANGSPTLHYRVNVEAVDNLLEHHFASSLKITKGNNGMLPKVIMENDQRAYSITDITTENTTDILNNSKAVGFEKITFKNNPLKDKVKEKNNGSGATYEWQDLACRLWQGIGLKGNPSPSFFKLVKKAEKSGKRGILYSAYSFVVDAGADDPEKLFYWKFSKLLKDG